MGHRRGGHPSQRPAPYRPAFRRAVLGRPAPSSSTSAPATQAAPPRARLLALDVFRGVAVAAMILVNTPGSWDAVYPVLRHSEWNGCTPTDLVFPSFLFIVGVASALALSARRKQGEGRAALMKKVLVRSASLIGVGLLMSFVTGSEPETFRIPGVLQRIGLVYGLTSALFLFTSIRAQVVVGGAVLLGYWAVMALVPVPGVGPANLEVGTNLAAWVDQVTLGRHVWQLTQMWDPEGVLSTLPAVVTGLAGLLLGHWVESSREPATKTAGMMVAGAIAVLVGLVWDAWFPINKSLWTSSFVVYAGGLASIAFGALYWVVDVQRHAAWARPFLVLGSNAMAAYVLAWLVDLMEWRVFLRPEVSLRGYLYESFFVPHGSALEASLAWAVVHLLLALLVMWGLYARRIFIRL